MVPMGDNFNHSHVSIVQEIINKKLQLQGDESSSYFQKTKFMNDYSLIYEGDESCQPQNEREELNMKGRFNWENFEANTKFTEVDKFRQSMLRGIQLWDVPCLKDTFDEDNDTEEEGSDSDDEEME